MQVIDQKITGYKVKSTLDPVIQKPQIPTERAEVLQGRTYKINPGDFAYYVTINDIIVDGKRRPYELFVNTKDIDHFQWVLDRKSVV